MERSIKTDLALLSNRGSRLRCTPLEMTVTQVGFLSADQLTDDYGLKT